MWTQCLGYILHYSHYPQQTLVVVFTNCMSTVVSHGFPPITVAALKLNWLLWFHWVMIKRNASMSMVYLTQLIYCQPPGSWQGILKKKEAPCHQHKTNLWSHSEATADFCWSGFQCGSSKFPEECRCLIDYSFFFKFLDFLCAFVA